MKAKVLGYAKPYGEVEQLVVVLYEDENGLYPSHERLYVPNHDFQAIGSIIDIDLSDD